MGATPPASAGPEARLLRPAEPGRFDPAELEGLAAPVRRHLAQAIAPGTALHLGPAVDAGSIKVGRWLPFRARQVLDPRRGFVWRARAAGLIAGVDGYLDGAGLLDWLPTALLPRFGARSPATPASPA